MRFLRALVAFSSVVLTLFLVAPAPEALACSCARGRPLEESFAYADAVFMGTVVTMKESPSFARSYGRVLVELQADTAWKGVTSSVVRVRTGMGGGDCGFSFIEGQRYLVFAGRESMGESKGDLITTICSPTASESDAGATIAALGPAQSVAPATVLPIITQLRRFWHEAGVAPSLTLVASALTLAVAALAAARLSKRQRLGALLIAAPVLANTAFTGLGKSFGYPTVLQFEEWQIITQFQQNQGVIMFWFAVLTLGAGLLAPISLLLRNAGIRQRTVVVGLATAFVQVLGLSRWLLLVPSFAAAGDDAAFRFAHVLLGQAIGENMGYLLTAAWTMMVLRDFGRPAFGRVLTLIGLGASLLILAGLLIPFGVPGAVQFNFLGYVLWSVWMIALGVRVLLGKVSVGNN